jgi:14-3-3 protein epsilon
MSNKYEKNVYIAMLAEQCNRFEEMVEFLEEMLKNRSQVLNSDERNLLSIAYKNNVTSKRTALRTVMAYELKEKKKENSTFLPFIQEYRKKIEDELTQTCNNVLNAIDSHLLPRAADAEAKVFYNKMKGDYNRYIAEYAQGDLKQKVADAAAASYKTAFGGAKELSPVHPISLGLALNYSVFFYEVLNDQEQACKIVKETLDLADKELARMEEEDSDENRDALSIVNLLRENLEMWKIESEDQ